MLTNKNFNLGISIALFAMLTVGLSLVICPGLWRPAFAPEIGIQKIKVAPLFQQEANRNVDEVELFQIDRYQPAFAMTSSAQSVRNEEFEMVLEEATLGSAIDDSDEPPMLSDGGWDIKPMSKAENVQEDSEESSVPVIPPIEELPTVSTQKTDIVGELTPHQRWDYLQQPQPYSGMNQTPTNPVWWENDLQFPQFTRRTPQGLTLDAAMQMAMAKSPRIQLLEIQDKDEWIIQEEVTESLFEVVKAYWRLYEARGQLVLSRKSYQLAQGAFESNPQDIHAKSASIARAAQYENAQFHVLDAQDRLVNLIAGPDVENTRFIELIPSGLVLQPQIQFDCDALVYVALINRPGIIGLAMQAGKYKGCRNQNECRKRLFGAISRCKSLWPNSNGIVIEEVAENQQMRKAMGDVVLDVKLAARELERQQQAIFSHTKALVCAMEQLQFESRNQANGIAELLRSQEQLEQAERRLLSSQAAFAIALVDLKRATGELNNPQLCADQYCSSLANLTPGIQAVPMQHVQPPMEHEFVPPALIEQSFSPPSQSGYPATPGNYSFEKLQSIEMQPTPIQ